jgi:hypothetical protein
VGVGCGKPEKTAPTPVFYWLKKALSDTDSRIFSGMFAIFRIK